MLDPKATKQAAAVVFVAAFADAFWSIVDGRASSLLLILFEVVIWPVEATVLFMLAKYLVVARTRWYMADYLLRTLGFSNAPLLLTFLLPNYGVTYYLGYAVSLWSIAAMVVAIREALMVTTVRAIVLLVVAFAFLIGILIVGLIMLFALYDSVAM